MEFLANTLADLPAAAKWLISVSGDERIFLFSGDMGAGKTTLIKVLCHELGITQQVSSPTFSLVNEYSGKGTTIFHFDLYRLKNEREALDFGIEEYLESGSYCFVEWPEKLGELVPGSYLDVSIRVTGNESRSIRAAILIT